MNRYKIFFILPALFLLACTKDHNPAGTGALTIIHAVVGGNSLVTNFSGTDNIGYRRANQIYYGNYDPFANEFGNHSGTVKLGLYQYPDTLPHSIPLFNLT